MVPHVILEDLSHKRIDSPATRGQRMQSPLAVDVLGDQLLDGPHLPPYALNAIDELLLLSHRVRHALMLYPVGYRCQTQGRRWNASCVDGLVTNYQQEPTRVHRVVDHRRPDR